MEKRIGDYIQSEIDFWKQKALARKDYASYKDPTKDTDPPTVAILKGRLADLEAERGQLRAALESAPEILVSFDTYFDWYKEVCLPLLSRLQSAEAGK